MSEWQPISTAPMDGTEFLATWGRQGHVMMLVSYDKTHGHWQSKGNFVGGFLQNATHWQRLPEAPK